MISPLAPSGVRGWFEGIKSKNEAMNHVEPTRVFLVGAGPGDPGLLTVRAVELLQQADYVLYDVLVPKRILDLIPESAERLCVRDLPGTHPDKYPHIHAKLIESARAGKRTVRLKGGDPLIFGRGGEETESLREAGIPYEIVPGITAAIASAACLDIPLTHRNASSAVALITGHEMPNKPGNPLDWQALAKFPGTLAIYMGIARLPLIVAELLKHGMDPQTPSAIVVRASQGEMRTTFAPLHELDQSRRLAGLESPGMVLIGDVVSLRPEKAWFPSRPLFGKHVVVTRPKHQAEPMLRKLELLGAVPYLLPVLEFRPPSDMTKLDQAIDQLRNGEWDWLVFTSANGVRAVLERLLKRGADMRALGQVQLAAIGPKTADTLHEFSLRADVVPEAEYNSEGLTEALRTQVAGKRVLLARANTGRDYLREQLSEVATVEQVTAYEQHSTVNADSEIYSAMRRGEISYVTLTSSNIARLVIEQFDETIRGRVERGEMNLVAISPETGNAIRKLNLPVAGEAEEYTEDGIIAELVRLAAS